jgi:UDP-N-acetylmuramate: L-alanyl-gamma-D-glutamyl-meso-diaminopimelate ligase
VPSEGRVVCPANTESLERVLKRGCWTPVERFSANGEAAPWQARVLGASKFEVLNNGEVKGTVEWGWSGLHNVNNALAVVAAAHAVGVNVGDACSYLSEFPGVKRRMELRGEAGGVMVYDDFAHHPTAIATTLEGAKARMVELAGADGRAVGRLIALFEPRSNTMKMGTLAQALPASFNEAHAVVCYTAGIQWNVRDTLGSLGQRLFTSNHLDEIIDHVVAQAQPGDWVVAMSNGSFGGIHENLIGALAQAAGAQV